MKNINILIIISFSFFIKPQYFNETQNLENTILLEIKTWKYTDDENFNYYLSLNPHSYYKLSANDSKFVNYDLILNSIYTDIYVGTPAEHILGFFSGKLNDFKIFFFNTTDSETLKILSNNKDEIRCTENFKFNCQKETYELKEMEFIKTSYSSLLLSHSFLGLQISSKDIIKIKKNNNKNSNTSYVINFVESLQKAQCKKLNISNFYWTIKYLQTNNNLLNNNIDGIFYFGEPPHKFDPINYNIEDFKEINTEAGYDNLYWGLKFDYIDLINKTNGKAIALGKYASIEYSFIYPELNFFITSENFYTRIKKIFFDKFIFKKKSKNYNLSICYEKYISLVDNINLHSLGNYNDLVGMYGMFYCNKTKILEYGEDKFYNEFPIISFHHLLLGYNFEFEAKDLFYEKNGEVYFLMTKKMDRTDRWIFGKAFMKKYQIVFNNDMKTLGFYLKNNDNKKNINPNEIINIVDNESNKKMYIGIIFVIFLVIIILYFLRFYCIKNRIFIYKDKRSAKELELINKYKEFAF